MLKSSETGQLRCIKTFKWEWFACFMYFTTFKFLLYSGKTCLSNHLMSFKKDLETKYLNDYYLVILVKKWQGHTIDRLKHTFMAYVPMYECMAELRKRPYKTVE